MQYRFADLVFEPAERRLTKAGEPVEMSSRYLDALALMLSERGKLVTKDRFMDEVWAGVPVTDEALTQAIRALRKGMGDDAANPRFIETVPKHGYRFVGELADTDTVTYTAFPLVAAGAMGGAIAGILGGISYGLAGGGMLPVLVGVTALLGLVGGAGIAGGIAIGRRLSGRGIASDVLGAAAGGLVVGALARLFGIDAFTLFFGTAPSAMTGASEGLLLGLATGAALHLGGPAWLRGAGTGAIAGAMIGAVGGRLMAGSLALAGATFDGRLSLPWFAAYEAAPMLRIAITAGEGALFVACLTLALTRRR